MKILAFSDLHRNRDAAQLIVDASRAADVVVGAGDFATHGIGLRDTIDLLRTVIVPMVLVAGNHDDLDELRQACCVNNATHVLHGEAVIIGGIPFFGLGFEIPAGRRTDPWNRQLDEEESAELIRGCPPSAVLVTHSPPFGCADVQRDGAHEGSRAVRDAVLATKPRLHLCGHIHHAWGTHGIVGECRVHNLGPSVNWFVV
jgi:Icc-related predicted phosphoesterase